MSRASWEASTRGLTPRDLAMHVVLPEVDGRIFANAIAFKERGESLAGFAPTTFQPVADRIDATADLASAWVRLRRAEQAARRVALVLANYPNRDGRLANGVGLDTPQSLIDVLAAMRGEGYLVAEAPNDPAAMMDLLQEGPTNALAGRASRVGGVAWPLANYKAAFAALPKDVQRAVEFRWGNPEQDPHVVAGEFRLGLHRFGNVMVGVQPARGYNIDPKSTYHDPDLVPPHHYLAFYLWLRHEFRMHAVVHLGKHGNLEWLPGKSTGLSADCLPDAVLGPVPHLYPFIVNDPGEGIQAKRRASAVIIDHLTPPMTRAELHDDLARLETLVDEYALAADLDPKRANVLAEDILSLARAQRLDADVNVTRDTPTNEALRALDAHLCDLKEMQIRDGLHVFGRVPADAQRNDLIVSIARLPRSDLKAQDASLHQALARDLGLGDFDPLTRDLATDFAGPRPAVLADMSAAAWRTSGDTVERIEWLALRLVAGLQPCDGTWTRTQAVLDWINAKLRPVIDASGASEIDAFLRGLDGRFVRPARPVRRRVDGRMCCRRGAISLRSMCGRFPPLRRGGSGSSRRSAWSRVTGRKPANGRARLRCRPGAPPTCVPAAMTSPRRWR